MGKIACAHCARTFRSQSGHAWHQDHFHETAPPSLDVDRDVGVEESQVEIESLSARLGVLEDIVDAISGDQGRNAELQEHILRIEKQLQALIEVFDKTQEERRLRDQAVSQQIGDSRELEQKVANAQRDIITLAKYVKAEVLQAMAEHPREPILKVYPD